MMSPLHGTAHQHEVLCGLRKVAAQSSDIINESALHSHQTGNRA
jgi:hypothetical protein